VNARLAPMVFIQTFEVSTHLPSVVSVLKAPTAVEE